MSEYHKKIQEGILTVCEDSIKWKVQAAVS